MVVVRLLREKLKEDRGINQRNIPHKDMIFPILTTSTLLIPRL